MNPNQSYDPNSNPYNHYSPNPTPQNTQPTPPSYGQDDPYGFYGQEQVSSQNNAYPQSFDSQNASYGSQNPSSSYGQDDPYGFYSQSNAQSSYDAPVAKNIGKVERHIGHSEFKGAGVVLVGIGALCFLAEIFAAIVGNRVLDSGSALTMLIFSVYLAIAGSVMFFKVLPLCGWKITMGVFAVAGGVGTVFSVMELMNKTPILAKIFGGTAMTRETIFVMFTLWLLVAIGVLSLRHGQRARCTEQVKGKIVKMEKGPLTDKGHRTHRPVYEFTYNGRVHQYSPAMYTNYSHSAVQSMVGRTETVYINPKDLDDMYTALDKNERRFYFLFLSLMLLIIPILMMTIPFEG